MEARQEPKVVEVIRGSQYEHPRADAVAMHPETVKQIKRYVESLRHIQMQKHGESYVQEDEDPPRDCGTQVLGWTVLKSRNIERGEVRFVQFLSDKVSA